MSKRQRVLDPHVTMVGMVGSASQVFEWLKTLFQKSTRSLVRSG